MPTPSQGYWVGDQRVPGTTTVIGRFKESGGLLQWAFQQGKSGLATLYEKRDEAANIGTLAHLMVEADINGEPPEKVLDGVKDEPAEKAYNAFMMYELWKAQNKINLLSRYQEIQLVSSEYLFGGTPDAIGEIGGEVILLDWKTSNGVYQDYLVQLAAYQHLINDGVKMDTGKPLDLKVSGGAHLLRFAKDYPDFGHHYFGDLSQAWRQFQLFREAYDIDKTLKKRAA